MSAREESVFSIIDSWDTQGPCCAKCRRGTRALPGPCGYDGECPNRCHEKGTR